MFRDNPSRSLILRLIFNPQLYFLQPVLISSDAFINFAQSLLEYIIKELLQADLNGLIIVSSQMGGLFLQFLKCNNIPLSFLELLLEYFHFLTFTS
jgi:hypothetical protein